jgi:outer membrane protein
MAAALAASALEAQPAPVSPETPVTSVLPAAEAAEGQVILLSLDDALRIGSGESETVWVARAGVLQAAGAQQTTRSVLFPQLSGTASYTRTLRSQFAGLSLGQQSETPDDADLGDLPFGQLNQYGLGLSLSQLLFDGGLTRSRIRATEARRRQAEIGVDAARAEALLDVTSAYFDALLADRLVEIAQSSLAQQEEILRQTDVAFRVGEKSEFEQLQARVSRDNQLPAVVQSRSRRQLAYLRLKQLLDVPLAERVQLTTPLDGLPPRFAETGDLATDARAPVRQANEELSANEQLLRGARAQRWPSVSVSSAYNPVAYPASGIPSPGDFRENWTVSLNLSVPILTGGRIAGDELSARGGLAAARARLQQAREAAELDVESSRLDLADAQAILTGNESTVEQARRGYEIAQLRYREGISSQIELSNLRLLSEQAEVNRAQALRNVQVARARLALIRDLPLGSGSTAAQGTTTAVSGTATAGASAARSTTAGTAGTSGITGAAGAAANPGGSFR